MNKMHSKAATPKVALTKTTLKNLTVSTGLKIGVAKADDSCPGCSTGCSGDSCTAACSGMTEVTGRIM